MSVLNTPPGAAPYPTNLAMDDRMARLLVWLGELIQQHGAGKYVVIVHSDGSVTVQRPRNPLEFHHAG